MTYHYAHFRSTLMIFSHKVILINVNFTQQLNGPEIVQLITRNTSNKTSNKTVRVKEYSFVSDALTANRNIIFSLFYMYNEIDKKMTKCIN